MLNRKNFGILALSGAVALSAIGVAFLTSRAAQGEPKGSVVATSGQSAAISSKTGTVREADSDEDGDGVPAWKEALLGTDPNNPDTDGDGVSDGDEIAAGVNPNQEGGEPAPGADTYVAPRGLTPTEALARELFSSYASARSGGSLDKGKIDAALGDILSRRLLEASSSRSYTLGALSVEDDVNLNAYEGSLARTLLLANAVREYELNVFARAANGGDDGEMTTLRSSAHVYEDVRDRLLSLDVPTGIAREHLALVNDVSALASATDALSRWSGDPLDALVLVNNFSAAETNVGESLNRLYTFLDALKKQT